jgi:hypothetical protein
MQQDIESAMSMCESASRLVSRSARLLKLTASTSSIRVDQSRDLAGYAPFADALPVHVAD